MISDFSNTPLPPPDRPPLWNHVFVDFENVPHLDFSAVGSKPSTFTILIGIKQTRMDMEQVKEILKRKEAIKVIQVTSDGKNTLDFVLAYQLGLAVARDAMAYFHIVSKDKGFEALISQLKADGIKVKQHADFSTLSFTFSAKSATCNPETPKARVLEYLRKSPKNRPGTTKRLVSFLQHALGAGATEPEARALAELLKTEGYLAMSRENGAIQYSKTIDALSPE